MPNKFRGVPWSEILRTEEEFKRSRKEDKERRLREACADPDRLNTLLSALVNDMYLKSFI